ncbi:nucleotide-binding universal stress UspA family protein [Maribacter spongiicola]|uniref:Nucleotide-binding universal stress UspA family protein n=1 Tax=Maribacter spongiicola TaxID=1206753 RepID=A0A4R7JRV5_9FLAO|nr:universal stress protein [Maribacter spongiicola]TDT40486.1 nucleotide-binding universal stress UspA family protein [Maribacter spongiicola]
MKKILITTDFSDNAWNAIFTALKIYSEVDCHFYLLHAFEPSPLNMMGSKTQQRLGVIYDSLSKYSVKELEEVLSYLRINHKNAKHQFTTISKPGNLEHAVESVLTENDIDILIMGTQGATGAKEVFLGSNTVKVLNLIKSIPILVVPTGFNFQSLQSILFATDFSAPYTKNLFNPIIELSKLWSANIEIVHVAIEFNLNVHQEAHKEVLKERLSGFDIKFKNIPFEINISKSIDQYAEEKKASFLTILRHQHTFWENVIGEPVVKKIAFHSKIPVIFLPQ